MESNDSHRIVCISSAPLIESDRSCRIPRDRIAEGIRQKLGFDFSLAQILESATWKGGREIAKEKRPQTCGSPIELVSDGTVF